jgi:pyruvate dehydrogenase E2 component (dihydrolipoamide acetyltransferase)
MKEGKVVSWLKSEGEQIEAGEAIMVVESDKADMDVEAFEDGFLAKIIVGEGEVAPVGEAVALIAESEADIESVVAGFEGGSAPAPADAVPDAAPVAGESRGESLRYSSRAYVVWIMSRSSHLFCLGRQLPLLPTVNSARSICPPCLLL